MVKKTTVAQPYVYNTRVYGELCAYKIIILRLVLIYTTYMCTASDGSINFNLAIIAHSYPRRHPHYYSTYYALYYIENRRP